MCLVPDTDASGENTDNAAVVATEFEEFAAVNIAVVVRAVVAAAEQTNQELAD